MNRKQLDESIAAFLATQSDAEADKDEWWCTPRAMASSVLQEFADFAAPTRSDKRIARLEAELAALKAANAGK
jgi:hypothetical protein